MLMMGYLCMRLIDLGKDSRAASKIQKLWRHVLHLKHLAAVADSTQVQKSWRRKHIALLRQKYRRGRPHHWLTVTGGNFGTDSDQEDVSFEHFETLASSVEAAQLQVERDVTDALGQLALVPGLQVTAHQMTAGANARFHQDDFLSLLRDSSDNESEQLEHLPDRPHRRSRRTIDADTHEMGVGLHMEEDGPLEEQFDVDGIDMEEDMDLVFQEEDGLLEDEFEVDDDDDLLEDEFEVDDDTLDQAVERGDLANPAIESGFDMHADSEHDHMEREGGSSSSCGLSDAAAAARRRLGRPRTISNTAPPGESALASERDIADSSQQSALHAARVLVAITSLEQEEEGMTKEQLARLDENFLKGWDIYNEEVSNIHDADWFKAALYHGRRVGIYRPMDSIEPALQRAYRRIALESPLLAARFAVSMHYGHWPTRLEKPSNAVVQDPRESIVAVMAAYPSAQETPPGVVIKHSNGEVVVDEHGAPVKGTGFIGGVCETFIRELYLADGAPRGVKWAWLLLEICDMMAVNHWRLHKGAQSCAAVACWERMSCAAAVACWERMSCAAVACWEVCLVPGGRHHLTVLTARVAFCCLLCECR